MVIVALVETLVADLIRPFDSLERVESGSVFLLKLLQSVAAEVN